MADEMKITDDDDGDTGESDSIIEQPKLSDEDDGDTIAIEDCCDTEESIINTEESIINTEEDNINNSEEITISEEKPESEEINNEKKSSISAWGEEVNKELMKLIKYRSQRKWYATMSIIVIFGSIIALMMLFVALEKDVSNGWKEILLVMIGAFVGSWSKVIDFWFNNSEQDNSLLESAND